MNKPEIVVCVTDGTVSCVLRNESAAEVVVRVRDYDVPKHIGPDDPSVETDDRGEPYVAEEFAP